MPSPRPRIVVILTEKIETAVNRVSTRRTVKEPRIPMPPMARGRLAAVTLPKMSSSSSRRIGKRHALSTPYVGARAVRDGLVRGHEPTDLVLEPRRGQVCFDAVVAVLAGVVAGTGELDHSKALPTIGADEALRRCRPIGRVTIPPPIGEEPARSASPIPGTRGS